MTDKQIINTCEFFNICESACGGTLEDTEICSCYELYKQLKAKEQECDMWKNLTVDNGAVALKYQQQIDQLKADNEKLKLDLIEAKAHGDYLNNLALSKTLDTVSNELDQLKASYEELKEQFKLAEPLYQACNIKDKKIDQLKVENEGLKTGLKQIQKQFGIEILYCKTTGESTFRSTEILKLKQTLADIKEVLNFYANSKIGEQQENGTYRVRLDEQYSTFYAHVPYFEYDPRPAKQAICKINEVENGI